MAARAAVFRDIMGGTMRLMLVAVVAVVGGCAEGGLARPEGTCRFSFSAPAAESGESTHCTLNKDGQLSLSFEDRLELTVADVATSGQARLEGVHTDRAALGYPNERFGLTVVKYQDQSCDDWAGHVFWAVADGGWHVEAVGTSACSRFTFAASFDSI